MTTDENVITLVVQSDNLSALELRLRWEECAEQVGSQKTERSTEVIEDQLGPVLGGSAVSWKALSFDPVADGEVESRADWQVNNR